MFWSHNTNVSFSTNLGGNTSPIPWNPQTSTLYKTISWMASLRHSRHIVHPLCLYHNPFATKPAFDSNDIIGIEHLVSALGQPSPASWVDPGLKPRVWSNLDPNHRLYSLNDSSGSSVSYPKPLPSNLPPTLLLVHMPIKSRTCLRIKGYLPMCDMGNLQSGVHHILTTTDN